MESFTNAGIFLVQTVFTIYIVILLIRILSPSLQGEYHNSIAQIILKLTSPLVRPIRRIIPYHRRIDVAVLILIIMFELLHLYLYAWLQTGYWIEFSAALIWSVGDLLHILISILFWAIVADALLSWIATPHRTFHEPRVVAAHLASPIMTPLRRMLPTMHGIDLAPIIALIVLKLVDIVAIYPIVQMGVNQSLGTN